MNYPPRGVPDAGIVEEGAYPLGLSLQSGHVRFGGVSEFGFCSQHHAHPQRMLEDA